MADFTQTTSEDDSPQVLRRLDEFEGRMGGRVEQLESRMDRMDGRFGNVEGEMYESKARRRAVGLVMRHLDLPNPSLVLSQESGNTSLNNLIQAAVRANKITPEQWDELQEADIIVAAADGRHVLIESSITPGDSDVIRAADRAVLLSAVTETEVIPAVISANINELQRNLAAEKKVRLFPLRR